jgi:SAM-dependent methyltransferase
MCLNSLRLGQDFKARNGLDNVSFVQMNLFRPAVRDAAFDLVISNGVLHHTPDPRGAFKSIAALVKPGGYVLIGLYHRYGRLITDFRRVLFGLSERLTFLDPNLRKGDRTSGRWRAWFMDQYKHPLESKHTIGEAISWLDESGFSFVKSIPRSKPFQPLSGDVQLFEAEAPGNAMERLAVELGMILRGSREGGFFTIIGRRSER